MAVFSDDGYAFETGNSEFDHLKFLYDEFATRDYHKLSDLAGKVKLVAYAIGHEKTINELVPFLSAKQMDIIENDNEFVRSLPNMWIDLAPHVGSLKNCEVLMKNMEPLITHHDEGICKLAVRTLKSFIMKSTDQNKNSIITGFITPLTQTLFTQGIKSIRCLKPAFTLFNSFFNYIKCESTRSEILGKVAQLIQPYLPYMRLKIVIYYMDGVCQIITKNDVLQYIIPGLNKLWKNEVMFRHRTKILETYYTISKKFDAEENLKHTLSIIKDACIDYELISSPPFYHLFVKFLGVYNQFNLVSHLVPIYDQFINSPMHVYKPLAIACLKYFVNDVNETEFQEKYIESITRWSQDPSPIIQNHLVEALLFITMKFGLDYANSNIRKAIYKIFLEASVEHRSNLLSNYPELVKLFLINEPDNPIKDALLTNADDKLWRNRLKFTECFIPLLRKLDQDLLFNKYPIILRKLMQDEIYAVRHATALQMEMIAKEMSNDEINKSFWPFLMEVYNRKDVIKVKNDLGEASSTPTYLIHINVLNVIESSVSTFSNDLINKLILPFIAKTLKDYVPNIRLKSMSIIENLTEIDSFDKQLLRSSFERMLEDLIKDDKHQDVRFTAQETLTKLVT